jgi:hypothetical protein
LPFATRARFWAGFRVIGRLRRIRQPTGLDSQRGYDRELLGLAFRTYLVIENSGWR